MAERRCHAATGGFSMIEMLVALVFTMVLMAGMASVFRASLTTFYAAGETTSSARRNRMSIDLLEEDLNSACMYLASLSSYPTVSSTNPPFYILPNMAITGVPSSPGATDPTTSDELYFYLDQPLPFEGKLTTAVAAPDTYVSSGATPSYSYSVNCADNASYAKLVTAGDAFIFKDAWETGTVASPSPDSTGVVKFTAQANATAAVTGVGSTGLPEYGHLAGAGVLFYLPAQMVRYRVQYLQLDPTSSTGIPCLVRDQGTYSTTGFVVDASQTQQIITENVQAFKVYLSVNSGKSWAGLGFTGTGFSSGWDLGIRALLDTQLAAAGRPDYQTTRATDEQWFRRIPTLVRVDVTTRTATERTEYASTTGTATRKQLTQSMILVPRHSGLPLT